MDIIDSNAPVAATELRLVSSAGIIAIRLTSNDVARGNSITTKALRTIFNAEEAVSLTGAIGLAAVDSIGTKLCRAAC